MEHLIPIHFFPPEFSQACLDRLLEVLESQDWPAVTEVLEELCGRLSAVLLYGSRSRGEEHDHSDYDLLVVAEQGGEGLRWIYGGLDLDIDVVDRGVYSEPLEGRLYLASGRILLDRQGDLEGWLDRLAAHLAAGAKPLTRSGRLRLVSWLDRMWRRSEAGGVAGALRGAALASSLPEVAMESLGLWPGSPLQNLARLREHWPEMVPLLEGWAAAGGRAQQREWLRRGVAECSRGLLQPLREQPEILTDRLDQFDDL